MGEATEAMAGPDDKVESAVEAAAKVSAAEKPPVDVPGKPKAKTQATALQEAPVTVGRRV